MENDPRTPVTDLRVVANDRLGLLARLGLIFLEEGISLQGAKIATLGERIDDIFYITGEDRAHHRSRHPDAASGHHPPTLG